MKVCFSDQMRRLDADAAEKFNIPGIVLMENAAIACANELNDVSDAVIVCGKGNNGGDGLAIARHLIKRGKNVKIYLVFGDNFSGDALTNYKILKSMEIKFYNAADSECLIEDLKAADCTVDAIFGTGFHGEVSSQVKDIIEQINKFSKYILSVDVPSGIDADTGEVETICIKADKTVTFAAYKAGMLMFPAANCTGQIVCADISIPEKAFEKIEIKTLDKEYINDIIPKRQKNSQKGDYGKIFVIGGHKGMAGAVCMACRAAFRAGAGIVTACVPKEINDIVQSACVQAMTYPVDFEKDADNIIEKIREYDVILFGVGIGREKYIETLLERVLATAKVPVVIDADGLFALAKNPAILKSCKSDIILTPHSAEMARLVGKDVEFVEKNRLSVSREFVLQFELTLVLKGNHSIITAPDGKQSINMTGNSGMATAGSGDVLAGITAAFAATCENTHEAAELAVYLHGAAGDYAAAALSEYSMTAPDLIESIPHILPVEKI